MFKGKTILSIIPARGGSKGLVGKNIIDCAGKPLIQWTIEASQSSRYIDRTIISTDSVDIAEKSRIAGGEVPFLRPELLATDEASIYDAIEHALKWLKNKEGQSYDYFLLLQPTSPLRTNNHIDEAIEHFFAQQKSEQETLVSVYRVDPKYGLLMRADSGKYIHFCFDLNTRNTRRQELPTYYLSNGAMYLAHTGFFSGTFYHDKTLFYTMPPQLSVDVDTVEDLEAAAKQLRGFPK